jgi:hypothetical protein
MRCDVHVVHAVRCGKGWHMQGEDVVEGLVLLFQRLRNEAERGAASRALRLLDDLLLLMDSDEGASEAARMEAAAERMDCAFDPNGGAPL